MSGASIAIRASSRRSTPTGAERSGRPCSAVQIAFAWTSAPGISSSPPTGVEWTSRSVGAVAPTTTMWSRIMSAGTRPLTTSANETVGIVPGGPRKSIQALPSRKPSASGGCPCSRSVGDHGDAVELAGRRAGSWRSRRSCRCGGRRRRRVRRCCAGCRRRRGRSCCRPVSLSLVARTAPPASSIASKRAKSSRACVALGELDVVDDLARAGGVQLGARRGRAGSAGTASALSRSPKVLASIPTTSRPLTGSAPRTSKRALSASRSSGASAPDSRAASAMPKAASATAPRATRRRDAVRVSGRRTRLVVLVAPAREVRTSRREVGVAGAHDDAASARQVADHDGAVRDAREGARAAVLGEPARAAHRGVAVAAVGAEAAALVAAPEAANAPHPRGAGRCARRVRRPPGRSARSCRREGRGPRGRGPCAAGAP